MTTLTPVPPRARRSATRAADSEERSNVSTLDRSRRTVRVTTRVLTVLLVVALCVVALGPLLWLFKAALSTSQDILREPFAWWPSGIQWQNLPDAWSQIHVGQYLLNTVWVAAGCWFFGLLVALTGGYGIAVLRPRYARVVNGAVLATLFIPGVVSLISLYVTVLDVPLLGVNLVNTFWAVWLPSAASAFNVLLVARFFAGLPRDVFEAARIDGAGVFRVFWSIVLPMSRPVIGVVSLLTIVASWKEFLWPLLVLPSPDLQPLSVGLYRVSDTAPTNLLMAGMFISVVIPVVLFLVFQRQFLRSAGQAGAVKG
ncbi:carbohydrate ABC transporter permease [Promicromonospora sukumoe]|uniref:Multiple sugar transport system permease protein n=1 Tax=Promicromonospora sukumoe TaxID=88382 RepID=A0A7W3PD64_9MICO|nr:carbohydrate ABC transporter permease [Promicromonospora sukumoe]MBA8807179.1 multiple sugar transport system permease protein [Promicromonospora sukumoe]